MKTKLALVALAAISSPFALAQGPQAYANDTNQDLYCVDLLTGNLTFIGNIGRAGFVESLAYDESTGRLFGHDTSGVLSEIDTTNGNVLQQWNTGLGNVESMDFYATNTLWMSDFASSMTLWGWDTSTNGFFGSLATGQNDGSVRAGAFEFGAPDKYVYLGDSPTFQSLWEFDGTTAALRQNGTGQPFVAAMDYVGSSLYALGDAGQVYSMNPNNGALTQIASTGSNFWLGMSTKVVPEPGTMIALGAGLAALLRRRRK